MQLVFASHNPHKLEEIKSILGNEINLLSLDQIGCREEIPEPFMTLEENAREKTRFVKENFGYDCFADDTGLEIEALNGEPGVFSARYALKGDENLSMPEKFKANIEKVLSQLKNAENREARFRTIISLNWKQNHLFFEGIVDGFILEEPRGEMGFGYDPVFLPAGFSRSFAEMTLDEKNLLSHRAIAFNKLRDFIRAQIY